MSEYILYRSLFHDLTLIHNRCPVCYFCYHAQVVCNKNNADLFRLPQFMDQLKDRFLNSNVQCSGRLITYE